MVVTEELELDQVQQHEASTKSSSPRPGLTTVIPTSRKSYARVDSAPPIYSGLTANQPQPPRALSPKIDKDIKRRISVRFDGAKFVVFNDAGFRYGLPHIESKSEYHSFLSFYRP